MAKNTRSITIKVPVNVAYDFIKDEERVIKYCSDLTGDVTFQFIRDVPNKEVIIKQISRKGIFHAGGETHVILNPVNKTTTEVTFSFQAGWWLGMGKISVDIAVISFISSLIALEIGYNSKK